MSLDGHTHTHTLPQSKMREIERGGGEKGERERGEKGERERREREREGRERERGEREKRGKCTRHHRL